MKRLLLAAALCSIAAIFAIMSPLRALAGSAENEIVWEALFQDPASQTAFMERKIHEYFPNEHVARVMIAIASCESTGHASAEIIHWEPNGHLLKNASGGQARGAFQVMSQVHAKEMQSNGLTMGDIDDYMTFVKMLYDQNGFAPWAESQRCWKNQQYARN